MPAFAPLSAIHRHLSSAEKRTHRIASKGFFRDFLSDGIARHASASALTFAHERVRGRQSMLMPHRPLGPALRRWRALNRVKQSHAAELLSVAQPTISRWESGAQEMEPEQRAQVERLVGAQLTSAGDAALARLVRHHGRGAHLICDQSHSLLALSASRRREFGCDAEELMGRSLWRFITEELAQVEAELERVGWFELECPPEIVAITGANESDLVPIRPGSCRLTRMVLSNGTAARLVETLT